MTKKLCTLLTLCLAAASHSSGEDAYLFTTFRGEASPMTEQVYFMVSEDGRNWNALNGAEPVLISTLGERGVRDPYILRAPEGDRFFLIATDLSIHHNGDWGRAVRNGSKSIVIWESEDLVNWSPPRLVRVAPEDAGCTWAPEAIYDADRGEYMVFWASTTGRDNYDKHRIWAAHTKDFKVFSDPFIYIEKPTTVIDTTIVREDGVYYRFTKDEQFKAITMEKSNDLMQGWESVEGFSLSQLTGYEGPACFKIGTSEEGTPQWCLLLDWYSRGRGYQPYEIGDLGQGNFESAAPMRFPFHPVRHGTVLPITEAEQARLADKWAALDLKATAPQVKPINLVVDAQAGTVTLPVMPNTDLTQLDPGFEAGFGLEVTPKGPQDFSKGPLSYQVGNKHTLQVSPIENHNPVLAGYYADPDILYSQKTGKFYLYPTSDGFDGWSGTYFKTFSSEDLVNWQDEGVILDLLKEVSWADRNAWAPCIIEKRIDGDYKFFYYFTAAQKIGVAVADDPTGPFVDSGAALIDFKPEGIRRGQEIDPEAFHDPVSGKDYLYWGNGYLAVAELNSDMTSFQKSSMKTITPDRTYREGATVFYREGLYYILWSEDDTRSPNYRVRYATAPSPTGPLTIPEDNLVIVKDASLGIYGTGHNSVLQIPGKDEWYIVYHRFNYPKGITMGESAGYHREVCIDRMEFDEAGHIIQVKATHTGIDPVSIAVP